MSVTTSHPGRRHLTVVTDQTKPTAKVTSLSDRHPGERSPAPSSSAWRTWTPLHGTACDTYDTATRELEAARNALTEAAWAVTEAEEAWSKAGAEMDVAARTVSAAREAAGVKLTASGYRPAVTS